jgi:hypothetical protein
MARDREREGREAAILLLKKKGYRITDISEGQGVPKWSRVQIENGPGSTQTCLIKTSTSGRISFTRETDGTFKFLRDADRVLHVHTPADRPTEVRISMFDKATIVDAFEANHKALVARKMDHIPSWVNPEPEDGWRQTGSGFIRKAKWSEAVPLPPPSASPRVLPSASLEPSVSDASTEATNQSGIMERIKIMLSEHMGVRPELIEIDVRVKI